MFNFPVNCAANRTIYRKIEELSLGLRDRLRELFTIDTSFTKLSFFLSESGKISEINARPEIIL